MVDRILRFLHRKELEEEAIFYPEWMKRSPESFIGDPYPIWKDKIDEIISPYSILTKDEWINRKIRRAFALGYTKAEEKLPIHR